ncbi:Chromate transport protein [Chitinispirillum alkaliphilum]|nr:Chromate transport protein [Chitinispirillum alkaliphilum]
MENNHTQKPPLLKLFPIFFKVGAFTVGGGLAMLSVLHHEIVTARKWIDEKSFSKQVTVATSIPGAIIVNFSILYGFKVRGFRGAFLCCTGVVMPAFLIMLFVSAFLFPYFDHPVVFSFLRGASASVSALLAYTAFSLGRTMLRGILKIVLSAAAFLITLAPWIHPVFTILLIGSIGYFLLWRRDSIREKGSNHE